MFTVAFVNPGATLASVRIYTIQIGSYKDKENAVEAVSRLKELGRDAFIRSGKSGNEGNLYRVYLNRFKSKGSAEKKAKALRASGRIGDYYVRAIDEEVRKAPFTLHISSFKNEVSARKEVQRLEKSGYEGFIKTEEIRGKKWFRVYSGAFPDEREAIKNGLEMEEKKIISWFTPRKIERDEKIKPAKEIKKPSSPGSPTTVVTEKKTPLKKPPPSKRSKEVRKRPVPAKQVKAENGSGPVSLSPPPKPPPPPRENEEVLRQPVPAKRINAENASGPISLKTPPKTPPPPQKTRGVVRKPIPPRRKNQESVSTQSPWPRPGRIKSANVNLRGGPSARENIVGMILAKGTPVRVLERSREWFKIKIGRSEAWVHESYLTLESQKTEAVQKKDPPPAVEDPPPGRGE